jgi:hypothetical protein
MQFESSMSSARTQEEPGLFQRIKNAFGFKPAVYDFNEPEAYCPPKFESDDPKLVEYFETNGFVVIKNAASPEEIQKGINLWWDLVEAQQPLIKRNDPSTWETWIASSSNGIMFGYGIGQSEFLWFVRQLPKVKEAFTKVWGTDDLLVSYDGCGVFRPVEFNPIWRTTGGWYHIDQNCYNRKGRHAVQGLMNFFPSGPHDGGFVVVPKSTHMIDAAFEKYDNLCTKKTRDFVQLFPEDEFWVEAVKQVKRDASTKYDLYPVKLVLDAGEFVLWDSRAIHCNHPVTKPSKDPLAKTQLKRLAAYVCMTPTALAKDIDTLVKWRIYAFQHGLTTTHWPHEFQPSFAPPGNSKLPGVGASVVKLTPEQAKLITGNSHILDVYDESIVAGMDLDAFFKDK